jgi:hypothetical protein
MVATLEEYTAHATQLLIQRITGVRMKPLFLSMFGLAVSIIPVMAFDNGNDNGNGNLQAIPSVFIGKAGDCGTGYPSGSRIVTSTWLTGLGLPDNGGPNTTGSPTISVPASTSNDPHDGLLLSKNGPTADCSSAGAKITGPVNNSTITELGFDCRNGGHCGAGAPRFNIITTTGLTYFAGCADGTPTPAPQDPTQWTTVRFTAAQIFPAVATQPPFVFGTTKIKSISIVFDEGTDTPSAQDPMGIGLATIDNIDISGHLITTGPKGGGEDNQGQDKNDN